MSGGAASALCARALDSPAFCWAWAGWPTLPEALSAAQCWGLAPLGSEWVIVVWGFVILGLVASILALEGLLMGLIGRGRRSWKLDVLVLVLIAGAWFAGHLTFAGWATLIMAALLEFAIRWSGRDGRAARPEDPPASDPATADAPNTPSPPQQAPTTHYETAQAHAPAAPNEPKTKTQEAAPALSGQAAHPEPAPGQGETPAGAQPTPAPEPAPPEEPRQSFTSCALLEAPCEVAAEVFFASLRRGGLREAELLAGPDGGKTIRIQTGAIILELACEAGKAAQAEINYAASQSWDWPEAASVAAKHAAHVLLTTRAPERLPRSEVVRLHRRAQAALSEFAPVVAVLWPGAGRLMPVAGPAPSSTDEAGDEGEPAATTFCVNFRVFPPAEGQAGLFVSDSVGLHAFGLPDVQTRSEREPDDAVSLVLYKVVEQIFAEGCRTKDGDLLDLGDLGLWRASRVRSRFEPEREVIELNPLPTDTPLPPPAAAPPASPSD